MENRNALIDQAWRKGALYWKLRTVQQRIYDQIKNSESLTHVSNCSRRIGKTFTMCVRDLEVGLQIQEAEVRIIAPTKEDLRKIIRPIMSVICADAPLDVRPVWKHQESLYYLPKNGSKIYLSGANNGHEDSARGSKAHRISIEEAGFVDNLEYLVKDVCMPQLITTGGNLEMYSSAPRSPDHDFVEYAKKAEANGSYSKFTIYDSGYPQEVIEKFKEEAGGENSTTWRREYLCEFVVDEESAIIPEWRDEYIGEHKRGEFFPFFHTYMAMDLGIVDSTVNLFGYYDFLEAKLIIEDEVVMRGPTMTTDLLAGQIKVKWKDLYGEKEPYRAVADSNNLLLLNDLSLKHQLYFNVVEKKSLEAMVNEFRILVGAGKVKIHPRCEFTIGCIRNGVWKENRKEFDRSKSFGHYDGLAAAIYLCRSLDRTANPIPFNHGITDYTHQILKKKEQNDVEEQMRKLFIPKMGQ